MRKARFQEFFQLGCRLELRKRIQFLECRRERVAKAPDCSLPEFLVLRLKVELAHRACKMSRSFQLSFDASYAFALTAGLIAIPTVGSLLLTTIFGHETRGRDLRKLETNEQRRPVKTADSVL
jgi:hypothetical protein